MRKGKDGHSYEILSVEKPSSMPQLERYLVLRDDDAEISNFPAYLLEPEEDKT